jgi:hypothetical protein
MQARAIYWSMIFVGVAAAANGCSGSEDLPQPISTPAAAGAGSPASGGAGASAGTGQAGRSSSAAAGSGTAGRAVAGNAAGAAAGGTAGAAAGAPATGGMGAVAGMAAAGGASGATTAPPTDDCDRMCLIGVMTGYLDALVAKDPTKIKTAATLKYTENGVVAKLGETIWKTASSLTPMARLDYADPVEGQVGAMVVVQENGMTPVLYMVRLKIVKHEITEIETMAVRRQGAANGFFNAANLVPEKVFLQPIDPAKRMKREELKALTEVYLDYLEGKKRGNEVAFDAGCKRYENGQVTASGLSSFNSQSWGFQVTRRILVIDEEAGITWGMFPFSQSASALVVGEAFKLIEGKIMMIQAVMANQPAKVWD